MQTPDVIVTWKKIGPGTREGLIVFGALFLLISLLLIWALYIRKPSRKRKRRYHYPPTSSSRDTVNGEDTEQVSGKKKWKRRRRDHRPRNPTLAETGGLPPIRSDDADPSV